jgi:BlaI family penicillinase repressor
MMPEPTMKTPRPTDAELGILRVLWERGPSTVRQVHDILTRERPTAYTTALKLLQIMTDKGLVRRDEADRTHIYHARLSEEQTQRQLVRDLLDRAFGGSSTKLVMQALATTRASAEELSEIRRLLDGRTFQDKGGRQGTPGGHDDRD